MTDPLTHLKAMEKTVDALVVNAEALRDGSSTASTIDELADLQKTQETLVAEIVQLNKVLGKADFESNKKASTVWERVLKKLGQFEVLNQKFIENMSIRQGILKFELHDVRQTRKAITQMKESYTRKSGPKQGKGPNTRVNTLS